MHARQNNEGDSEVKPLRVLRENECKRMTGVSRTQRWRLERAGKFPRRMLLGEKAHGWLEHEIQEWIRARMARRDHGET